MAKRKRKELTLQEKVGVIDFKNKNPATALGPNKFQCGKTQIQSILHDQQNPLDKFTASGNSASKRARTCRFQDIIDLAMVEWFRKARSKNIPVSGPIL